MERTKLVTYQSCDLCDNPEETQAACDICHKYLCASHSRVYPWGDQLYYFCSKHYELVNSIIKETGIPIGFVVYKLTVPAGGENYYHEQEFIAHYAARWKDEWRQQV